MEFWGEGFGIVNIVDSLVDLRYLVFNFTVYFRSGSLVGRAIALSRSFGHTNAVGWALLGE